MEHGDWGMEEVRAVAYRMIEAWNSHDPQQVAALHSLDYIGTDVAARAPLHGRVAARRHYVHFLRAFPDLTIYVDSVLVDGDEAVIVWRTQGTHRNSLLNVPPSGRRISVSGVSIMTIKNGLVARSNRIWDVAGFLRGVGLLPELAPSHDGVMPGV